MKKILLLFLAISVIVSCKTTKKVTDTKTNESRSVEIVKKFTDTSAFSIDTSKSSDMEVIYRKIEYFNPDSVKNSSDNGPAIKSEETFTMRNKTDQEGKTEVQNNVKADSSAVENTTKETETKQVEKPAPDPFMFRYIFYILLLAGCVFLYLKVPKTKVFLKKLWTLVKSPFK